MIDRPNILPPTPEEVIAAVCDRFRTPRYRLLAGTRHRTLVQQRYICWLLIKELCIEYTLLEMGAMFGDYDHSTVIHGLRTIAGDIAQSDQLRKEVTIIRERLRATVASKRVFENLNV